MSEEVEQTENPQEGGLESEEAPDLDTAFDQVDDEGLEGVAGEGATAEEAADAELDAAEAEHAEGRAEKGGIDWSRYGLDEYKGKPVEEAIAELAQKIREAEYRNKLYGQQANELGRLRKELEELKAKKEPEKSLEELLEYDEDTLDAYRREMEINPVGAFVKYIAPALKQEISKQVKQSISEGIREPLSQASEQLEMQQLLATNPDAAELMPAMQVLDSPENLGTQRRSYFELYKLAKLGTAKDPLYPEVYKLMYKHPSMSFDEAKNFASMSVSSKSASKTSANDNKKPRRPAERTAKPASKQARVFATLDEAFDSVSDET